MSKVLNKVVLLCSVCLCMMVTVLFCQGRVNAISEDEIYKRILINNTAVCYGQSLRGTVQNEDLVNARGYSSNNQRIMRSTFGVLMNDGYRNGVDRSVMLPAFDGPNTIGCLELFVGGEIGGREVTGLFQLYDKAGIWNPSTGIFSTAMVDYMKYGIKQDDNISSEEYCYTVKIRHNNDGEGSTGVDYSDYGSFCLNADNFPIDATTYIEFKDDAGNPVGNYYSVAGFYGYEESVGNEMLQIVVTERTISGHCTDALGFNFRCSAIVSISPEEPILRSDDDTLRYEDFENADDIAKWENKPPMVVEVSKGSGSAIDSRNTVYEKYGVNSEYPVINDGRLIRWRDFLYTLSNGEIDVQSNIAFSDADKYDLYKIYLTNNYGYSGVGNRCYNNKPSSLYDVDNGVYLVWAKDVGWCEAQLSTDGLLAEHEMTVFSSGQSYRLDRTIYTLPDLISVMGDLNYENDSFVNYEEPESPQQEEAREGCWSSGAARSLGWIVCTVLDMLGWASDSFYDNAIKPSLQVNSRLFEPGEDGINYALQAWTTFQNIANVVFICLLLFVIFSQLTGVGIDNYGIKKILPKLIIVAILVNLSFYICQIMVDASNIVGTGVQSLFDGLSARMTNGIDGIRYISGGADGAIDIEGGILNGESIGFVPTVLTTLLTVGAGAAVITNPGIVVSLLVTGLGLIIALCALFALLAGRQALVVVLTVISPLAVVCYMLPNTKKIYDKWLKMLEAMLILFPICSLVVAGGNYVSSLMLTVSMNSNTRTVGFWNMLTSILVGIVPVFFIPSLIKGSFAAFGKVGAQISGFGRTLSGAATKGIRGSERYKGLQQSSAERSSRIMAGVDRNGNARDLGRWGRLWRGGSRRVAMARAQYRKDINDRGARNELLNRDVFNARLESDADARLIKGYDEQFAMATKDDLATEAGNVGAWYTQPGGTQKMISLLRNMEANGMEKDMVNLMKKVNIGENAKVLNSLNSSKNRVFKAYAKKGAGLSWEQFMTGKTIDPNSGNITSTVYNKRGGGYTTDPTEASSNVAVTPLADYINDKGSDFINDLDDKAIGFIADNDPNILTNDLLVEAAARINSQDAVSEIDKILAGRSGVSFTAAQFSKFNQTTQNLILGSMRADSTVKASLRGVGAAMKSSDYAGSISNETKSNLINYGYWR